MKNPFTRYVFPTAGAVRYTFPTHANQLVVDRSEAEASEVFVVVLAPGQATHTHAHSDTEQVFYVIAGRGTLTVNQGSEATRHPVMPGDVVRIPPATTHSIRTDGDHPLRYLAVDCFPGGRPKDEPTWEDHVRVVCHEQGWDVEQVRKAT